MLWEKYWISFQKLVEEYLELEEKKKELEEDELFISKILINDQEKREKINYNNGDIYDGILKKGKKNKGIMKYNNGDEYEGNWKNEMKEGEGRMKYI